MSGPPTTRRGAVSTAVLAGPAGCGPGMWASDRCATATCGTGMSSGPAPRPACPAAVWWLSGLSAGRGTPCAPATGTNSARTVTTRVSADAARRAERLCRGTRPPSLRCSPGAHGVAPALFNVWGTTVRSVFLGSSSEAQKPHHQEPQPQHETTCPAGHRVVHVRKREWTLSVPFLADDLPREDATVDSGSTAARIRRWASSSQRPRRTHSTRVEQDAWDQAYSERPRADWSPLAQPPYTWGPEASSTDRTGRCGPYA